LRLCGTDLKETQRVFRYKFLFGEIILFLQLLNILLIQKYKNNNNKLTSNQAGINNFTAVNNLRFAVQML
jgi:hypothetical protein